MLERAAEGKEAGAHGQLPRPRSPRPTVAGRFAQKIGAWCIRSKKSRRHHAGGPANGISQEEEDEIPQNKYYAESCVAQ